MVWTLYQVTLWWLTRETAPWLPDLVHCSLQKLFIRLVLRDRAYKMKSLFDIAGADLRFVFHREDGGVVMWYTSNSRPLLRLCLQLSIYTIYNLWWREQWTFPEVLARLIGQIRSLVAGSLHLPRSPTNILALNTENILSYRKNF